MAKNRETVKQNPCRRCGGPRRVDCRGRAYCLPCNGKRRDRSRAKKKKEQAEKTKKWRRGYLATLVLQPKFVPGERHDLRWLVIEQVDIAGATGVKAPELAKKLHVTYSRVINTIRRLIEDGILVEIKPRVVLKGAPASGCLPAVYARVVRPEPSSALRCGTDTKGKEAS